MERKSIKRPGPSYGIRQLKPRYDDVRAEGYQVDPLAITRRQYENLRIRWAAVDIEEQRILDGM